MFSLFRKLPEVKQPLGIEWKWEVLRTLVEDIFPEQVPYHYDSAFSFLQTQFTPEDPVRLDLFYPDYPLAVDVLTEELSTNFEHAEELLSYEEWSRQQARISEKRALLDLYHCPYLLIRHHEPVDAFSLRERVRILLGRYPD